MPESRSPLISIVIANFNSGEKLRTTYSTIALQAEKNIEILIVDGCSSDGSKSVADGIAETDGRVKIISEPDSGVYDAMNKGIRLTRGAYVYFLGAGDELLDGCFQAIRQHLVPGIAAFIYGDTLMYGVRYNGRYTKWKLNQGNICHQSIFYSRKALELCGEFNLKYKLYADWEYNMRAFGDARITKRFIPVVIARFEEGGLSQTKLDDPQFRKDHLALARKHFGFLFYLNILIRPKLGLLKQKIVSKTKKLIPYQS